MVSASRISSRMVYRYRSQGSVVSSISNFIATTLRSQRSLPSHAVNPVATLVRSQSGIIIALTRLVLAIWKVIVLIGKSIGTVSSSNISTVMALMLGLQALAPIGVAFMAAVNRGRPGHGIAGGEEAHPGTDDPQSSSKTPEVQRQPDQPGERLVDDKINVEHSNGPANDGVPSK